VDGKTVTLGEAARLTGIAYGTLVKRIQYGWSLDKLTAAKRKYTRKPAESVEIPATPETSA